MFSPHSALLAVLLGAALAGPLVAQVRDSSTAQILDTLTVTGRYDDLIGIAATASEGRVGSADLRLRPIAREGELLETVPGLIVTQHSGDGKANQYFIRGFNLDHGTDFQTRIEGMPVNMPSHAHGQGYTGWECITPSWATSGAPVAPSSTWCRGGAGRSPLVVSARTG
jgi:outer membrane cobalamin receptor